MQWCLTFYRTIFIINIKKWKYITACWWEMGYYFWKNPKLFDKILWSCYDEACPPSHPDAPVCWSWSSSASLARPSRLPSAPPATAPPAAPRTPSLEPTCRREMRTEERSEKFRKWPKSASVLPSAATACVTRDADPLRCFDSAAQPPPWRHGCDACHSSCVRGAININNNNSLLYQNSFSVGTIFLDAAGNVQKRTEWMCGFELRLFLFASSVFSDANRSFFNFFPVKTLHFTAL